MLYQGSDVWLNTPRRPMEASGTSGEKAALNGALNCSILDGWWDEMFDGHNGWAISSAEHIVDLPHRDEVEANSLFEILERQIVPLYYDRGGARYPRGWVGRIKSSISSLGPRVMASRMVRDYVVDMYEPTAGQTSILTSDGFAGARSLAEWKKRVIEAWPSVKVVNVDSDDGSGMVDLGAYREVTVDVELGSLGPSDVAVELLHGPVVGGDELVDTQVVRLSLASGAWESGTWESGNGTSGGGAPGGLVRYHGKFACNQSGRQGYTVRIVPSHPRLVQPVELGCIAWA
jgi:starch phosphorylase